MSLETMESKYSYGMLSENTILVFIENFIRFFKTYPEIRSQYFVFLNNLSEEEMRISPRLQSHASGVVLGITQIINGLENPVQILVFRRCLQIPQSSYYLTHNCCSLWWLKLQINLQSHISAEE